MNLPRDLFRYGSAFLSGAGFPLIVCLLAGSFPATKDWLTALGSGLLATGFFHKTSPKDAS